MNGSLGKAMTVAGNFATPYTVPATVDFATVNLNLCNKGTTEAKVRIALTSAATPNAQDYIEYDAVIAANGGVLERTCQLMDTNEKVMVYADSANVAIRVSGLEELLAV